MFFHRAFVEFRNEISANKNNKYIYTCINIYHVKFWMWIFFSTVKETKYIFIMIIIII